MFIALPHSLSYSVVPTHFHIVSYTCMIVERTTRTVHVTLLRYYVYVFVYCFEFRYRYININY